MQREMKSEVGRGRESAASKKERRGTAERERDGAGGGGGLCGLRGTTARAQREQAARLLQWTRDPVQPHCKRELVAPTVPPRPPAGLMTHETV